MQVVVDHPFTRYPPPFRGLYGMGVVIAQDSSIVLIVQGQTVTNAVWDFLGLRHLPSVYPPSIPIISMHLGPMQIQKHLQTFLIIRHHYPANVMSRA